MDNTGDSKTLNNFKLESLQKKVIELQTQLQKEREEKEQLKFAFGQRNKVLQCHKSLSTIFGETGSSEETVFNKILDVISSSFQFSRLTEVCLIINDKTFKTEGYISSKYELVEPIFEEEELIGKIIVGYPTGKFQGESEVFLYEEIDLLHSIAERLGNYMLRIHNTQKLHKSVNLYQTIIETLPDALVICDLSGRVKYYSKKGGKIFGYSETISLEGKSIFEFLAEKDHSRAAKAVEDMVMNGYLNAMEFTGLKANDDTFPIEIVGELIWDKDGNPNEILCSIRDISTTKRLEESLIESERTLTNIMNNLPGIAYRCLNDASWTMLFVSAGCMELTGYPSKVFVGEKQMPYNDIIHPGDQAYVAKEVEEGLRRANSFEIEYRIVTAEGEVRHVWEKGQGVVGKGKILYLEGLIMDITNQHKLMDKLAESEFKYRNIFENIQDTYYEASLDGIILEISPSVNILSHGQYQREDLIGKSVFDIYADPSEREILFNEMFENGKVTDFELKLRNKDGSLFPVAVSATFQKDNQNNPIKLVGNLRDISERKQAEQIILEQNMRLSSVLNSIPDSIFILNRDGTYQKYSSANELEFNLSGKQENNSTVQNTFSGEQLEFHLKKLEEGFSTGMLMTYEFDLGVDDQKKYYEARLNKMDENRAIVIVQNVTEKHAQNLEIQKLSMAVEQSPAMTIITDMDGNIEYVNDAFIKVTGYTSEDVIGKNPRLFSSAKTQKLVYEDMWRTLKSGNPWRGERQNQKKSGELFWEDVYIMPFKDQKGEINKLLAIKLDITERKEAERKLLELNADLESKVEKRTLELSNLNKKLLQQVEEQKRVQKELLKARTEAEKANAAKSEFLSRMSHELRTPMNSILGFAQLLERGDLPTKQLKAASHIRKSGNHLLALINEVLDISRIEAGRMQISFEPVSLTGITQQVIDLIMPLANERAITINVSEQTNELLYLRADVQRMKQIILNLLSNAVKYNNTGGQINIGFEKLTNNSETTIRIAVSDTGVGIDPKSMTKLFKPFERIGAENTAVEGSGLGLWVTHQLVEAMGGKIGVDSRLGEGSIFWVEMPACEKPERTIKRKNQIIESTHKKKIGDKTVVCVEDNPLNLELIESILTDYRPGIELKSISDGEEAVAFITLTQPDLIILDLNLPGVNGDKILEIIKADEKLSHTPVIIISADAVHSRIDKLKFMGADNYLTKPLDLISFLATIDNLLKLNGQSDDE